MNDSRITIENNILKGKVVPFPPFEYTSFGELVLARLKNNPELVGQIDVTTGEKYTFNTMRDGSVRCALWMRKQGLLPGDVVTMCSHNQLDLALPCFATLYLGAVINPLDVGMNKRDFSHVLKITSPKMAFVNEDIATTFAEAVKETELDVKIVVLGRVPGFLAFQEVIAEQTVEEVQHYRCTPIKSSDETAVIMCTSGTSGFPKGVALTHALILNQLHTSFADVFNDTALIISCLAWISGVYSMLIAVAANSTRLLPPPFEEYTACALIEKFKIKSALLSPSMLVRLVKSDALKKYDLSSLETVMCGGSVLPANTREAFNEMLPHASIIVGYGMTEVGGAISIQTKNSKPGSCGSILDNCQLKVVDPDTGRLLGVNQLGELLLKNGTTMAHYYKDPQATACTIDEEGWLHSGDLGYYDEDGEIFIVDRLKEMIKYQGYQISPADIEDVLLSHPGVKEAVVVSVPHPVDNEHPIAFVVRRQAAITDKQVTEEELIDLVATEMADSKRLRGGVRFVDHLPKTPSNKVQRRDVRKLARAVGAT
ncbi:4-coumarate--CoA ligase 1 [Neodiprion lecontei]|uniref:4-coumarate--CoA ligase 1 n=1 Tax=Neodiprion lecontei TaxID=441921 RepID=A0A6J0C4T9_NEOLC|nr:4-coumarate--CoA ligase 1 [Neodiprion lecontei]